MDEKTELLQQESGEPKKRNTARWFLRNPLEAICIFIATTLIVIVFLQVVLRYAFHSPLAWSEESATFLFQWFNFLGAAVAVRRGFHFQVDLVVSRLSGPSKAATQILGSIVIFAVAYIMLRMGIEMTNLSKDYIYPSLQFSSAYSYVAIPISGALIIIFQIPIFIREIKTLIKGGGR